jgi:hypothetical protein
VLVEKDKKKKIMPFLAYEKRGVTIIKLHTFLLFRFKQVEIKLKQIYNQFPRTS